MKRNMILIAVVITALAGSAFATPKTLGAQTAQENGQESKNKEKHKSRDQEENDHEDSDEPQDQSKLASQAKITKEQAREIALKRAPGTIEEEELEREHGKLVYSFDIRNAQGTITEVQVNAKDGSIVSVEEENAKQEADEKRKEGRKP